MRTKLGLALAAGACVALGSAPARAVPDGTGCMPPVIGVPWSGAAPDTGSLDDLKWNGAFAYDWSTGTLLDGEFRNLLYTDAAGNRTLYVYYQSHVRRTQINYGDGFQYGISFNGTDGSGNKTTTGLIINATFGADNTSGPWTGPTVDSGNKPVPIAPGGIHFVKELTTYAPTGEKTSPSQELPVPTWLGSPPPIFLWIFQDPGDKQLWFVAQMKIPISTTDKTGASGLYVDPSQFATPSLGVPFFGDELTMEATATAGVVARTWPNSQPLDQQGRDPTDPYQPPTPEHWGILQPSAPTPAGACTGGGLRFGPSDILNNGGYTINLFSTSGGTPVQGQNYPSVNITNVGPTVDITNVKAVFNIAPMGSQDIHSFAWQPLNINNNAIKCKSGTTGDYATCNPQPVASSPLPTMSVGGSSAFTVKTINPWVPDWSYTCAVIGDNNVLYDDVNNSAVGPKCAQVGQFLPSLADAQPNPDHVLHEHQCMLVQLSATNANVQFDTQAQFQNMHVAAHASHFEEKARIDISGAPKIKGAGGHWVYIVVETRNMLHDIPNGIQSPFTQDKLSTLLYGCDGEDCNYNPGNLPAFDYVASQFSTTVMHVYRDTGLKRKIGHKKLAVLEPQSSYGYFVSHDGMLYGWDVAIKGAKKIAPNVYRLWIKDDGAVDVVTSIDALDKPRCNGGGDDDGGDDD